jgi:iron complex outermembrane receptor protein
MDGWNRIDDYNILANPFTTTRPAVTLGPRQLFTQIGEPFTDDYFLGDVRLRYSFGGGMDLTSITSYNNRDILVVRDATALTASITGGSIGKPESVYTLDAPLDDATTVSGFTQEVRLEGGAGGAQRLRWLFGGFYSTQERKYGQSLIVNGYQDATGSNTIGLRAKKDELFFSDLAYNLDQFALFGEATWALGNQLDITGGLRYYNFTEDRDQVFDGIFAHDSTGTKVVSQPGSTKADGIAPRVIASWRTSDALTINAQVAKGFRLGGINDPLNVPLCTPGDLATFSGHDSWVDESAWNYELGTKSSLMNGRGSLNVSAFYMDIQDLQLVLTAGSCSSRLVFNVPKARTSGLEVEFAATPNEHLDFAVSGTFNNSELRSTVTQTDSLGNVSPVSGIVEGNRLPSVPELQGAAAATYKWRMGGPASVAYVTGSWSYVGTRYTQIDDLAAGFGTVNLNSFAPNNIGGPFTQSTFTFNPEMPAYNLLNLRVGLTRANYDISLYMNNVTDERALLALDRERGTRARVGFLTNPARTIGLLVTFQR